MRIYILFFITSILFFSSCKVANVGLSAEKAMLAHKYEDSREKDKGCFVETKEGKIIETENITLTELSKKKITINGKEYNTKDLVAAQTLSAYYVHDDYVNWSRRIYKGKIDIFIEEFVSTTTSMNRNGHMTTSSPINVKLFYITDPQTKKIYSAGDYQIVSKLIRGKGDALAEKYLNIARKKYRNIKINRYSNYAAMALGGLGLSRLDPELGINAKRKDKLETPFLISGFMALGGFVNWFMGGMIRNSLSGGYVEHALYVYNFGEVPSKMVKRSKKKNY